MDTSSDPKITKSELSRRSFLHGLIAVIGAVITAVLGGSGLAYFSSPLFQKKKEEWMDIGGVKDFSLNAPTKVEFVQRTRDAWFTTEKRSTAWVLTSNARDFIVFDPRCTHLGCPYRWDDQKKEFLCPCHTAAFGMDGRVISGPPPRPLDRYTSKVLGGRVMIFPGSKESIEKA